ncbi:ankyrin repeat and SOCS box protein 10 isoform X2 [Dipodomys spectabilis]|uniref:ankyrin repeat and SOCS box protein 10 isoform X2 n=1 Tax=Dipodomys spectabilis TaxID=105255 RepID=UPI001C53A003|nr:ankyrin repeat and SOCS box protein 10 isoform X2 [Dipodomys spectabilis]
MPKGRNVGKAMAHGGHPLGCLPSVSACHVWGVQSCPAQAACRSPPLPCRDMALQNALYTGDLARLQELFPPHSTADLLLESRTAEPRWSSHQRGKKSCGAQNSLCRAAWPAQGRQALGVSLLLPFSACGLRALPPPPVLMSGYPEECGGQGEPHGNRHSLCARLVESSGGSEEPPGSGPGPIAVRTAAGPALTLWQAVLAGDVGSIARILADSSAGLAPDSVFDTSDPERWRDFRFNIRALRLWSLTYEEELTTPLHVAASRGYTDVLRLLLRRRARPDSAPGGRTALHEACAAGHPACVHVLLVAGADPNAPDQEGKRPLHLCRGAGSLECVELLLKFGARVNGQTEDEKETALHVAARLGHVEMAALLLRRGACPDARNAEGWTPLLAACDARGQSPAEAEASAARCFQLCSLLLSAGADADAADQDKLRPLHLACRRGHSAVVELLLSHGVSANAMDYGGHTALHCALQGPAAALAQSPEHMVRALLNHGAVRVWPGALPKAGPRRTWHSK